MSSHASTNPVLRVVLAFAMALSVMALFACSPADDEPDTTEETDATEKPPVDYYVNEDLAEWIDPDTGYDTTREWDLEGGDWPICLINSPSQSPQAIVGMRDGVIADALEPHGVTPVLERIDLPPRTFAALERSKWPFVYMPIAVFMDYVRSPENQGGAGGLQYVALAGSTAGGGYTLVSRDPEILDVAGLAGRTVGQINANPVPAVLLEAAAGDAGLALGDGPNDIDLTTAPGGEQLTAFENGELDGVISLNIFKGDLIEHGAHAVTDFSDVDYIPNYTILVVERTVLEDRPEVVDAFLEAHFEAHGIAEQEWETGLVEELFEGWNAFYEAETVESAAQRIVPNLEAYEVMLGDMYPEDRLDAGFLEACFEMNDRRSAWGWDGEVDTARLLALDRYDAILVANGQEPQE